MSKITMELKGSGIKDDPFRVNLPRYNMIGKPNYANMTVQVEVPDDELTKDKTAPDKQRLREKYHGQPAWDCV